GRQSPGPRGERLAPAAAVLGGFLVARGHRQVAADPRLPRIAAMQPVVRSCGVVRVGDVALLGALDHAPLAAAAAGQGEADRPGASAVRTPTKPGQVTLKNSPAGPRMRATSTWRPSPSSGQSRVRSSHGASWSRASVVQHHWYELLRNQMPG